MSVGGCAEGAVDGCDIKVVVDGFGLSVVCDVSCGSAVVLVPVVTGCFDVVDIWASVVGTSVLEVCGVTTTVVLKPVFAVVAVAVVVKVDGVSGLDEVVECGSGTVEPFVTEPPVVAGLIVVEEASVGLTRSVTS